MCRAESGTKMKKMTKTKLDRRNMEDSKNLNSYIMIAGYAFIFNFQIHTRFGAI